MRRDRAFRSLFVTTQKWDAGYQSIIGELFRACGFKLFNFLCRNIPNRIITIFAIWASKINCAIRDAAIWINIFLLIIL